MHFFIEPALLNAQTAADAYGPQSGSETTKYNISSRHTVSAKAKIFACQDAMMLVRPQVDGAGTPSTTLVNIILKPISRLEIPFINVKYFIYRGVDRSSLVVNVPTDSQHPDGIAISPNTGAPTQFISRFWKKWADFKTNTNQLALDDPLPKSLGYDTATSGTTLVEELFNSAFSTNIAINDFQTIRVSEGEWVSNLQPGTPMEFEIITDTDHLTVDLDYVQQGKQIVDATGLLNYEQTVAQESIVTRDTVLNYLDPAAFFGMFFNAGVKIHNTYDTVNFTNTTTLKRTDQLVLDVINTFLNKDLVYLDIRSERGYSYYHHRNYLSGGFVLEWKSETQATFNALNFGNVYWPLINLKQPPASLAPINHGERIELKLMVLDNTKPLLFFQNPELLGSANTDTFIKDDKLVDFNAASGLVENLSKIIRLEVPHIVSGTNKINVAYHIKLQYFRQEYSATPPVSVFKSAHYLDSVFGGIKHPVLDVVSPFQEVVNSKLHFVNSGGFSFAAHTGAIVKGTLTLFYSENAFSLLASGNVFPEINVTNEPSFDGILKRKNAVYNKISVTDSGTSVQIISIVGYNRTSSNPTPRENIHLLGLTKAELDAINAATITLDIAHKYFVFEAVAGTIGYIKYQIKVQGLDSAGVLQTVSSFGGIGTLMVFGTNTSMLCSANFALAVDLPISIPDPGIFTDFIDFSLYPYDGNDPLVTDLFIGGTVNIGEMNFYSRPFPATQTAGLIGEIFYPVDSLGSDVISTHSPNYPVIIINHANGGRYSDYRALAEHLAKNGFIVSNISCLISASRKLSTTPATNVLVDLGFSIIWPLPSSDFYIGIDNSNFDAIYALGINAADTTTYQKLLVLRGVWNYTATPVEFIYSYHDVLSWKNGIDFDFYAVPAPMVWERVGKPAKDLSKFGLTWNSNIESPPGNFKAVLKKAGDKLVELTAANWALTDPLLIEAAIDGATNISSVNISFPSTSVNKYLGTKILGKYFMIHFISSTSSSAGSAGTRVRLSVEIKNGRSSITFNFDVGRHDMGIFGRSNMVYPHLQILRKFMHDKGWSSKLQNKIGLIGHSRGAEAVVRCASDIVDVVNIPRVNITTIPGTDPRSGIDKWKYVPNDLFDVKAVISLAPTDGNVDASRPLGESISQNMPYFVLYGSLEGDVIGNPNPTGSSGSRRNRTSGFSIYDRTNNATEKAMSFVYGATHNGFITTNADYLQYFTAHVARLLDVKKQRAITLAYMNAFMRLHIKGESQWRQLFHGTYIPPSTQHTEIYPQFKNMGSPVVPGNLDFETSATGVNLNGNPASVGGNLRYDAAVDLSANSPHDTKAIRVNWVTNDVLSFAAGNINISTYTYLSFRIGHIGAYSDLSQMMIKLIDTVNTESTATLNRLVPQPYLRSDINIRYGNTVLTKSQMTTLRIPISEFTIGANLTAIDKVQLTFPAGSGSVLIDDVEFTN